MTHSYAFAAEPLSGEDLNLLHGTLRKWCDERGIEINAPEAEQAAVELMTGFSSVCATKSN